MVSSTTSAKSFQFNSVALQFKRQLNDLMGALGRLSPHYVRCVKPSTGGGAGMFDAGYTLQQLKCGGVMEAVRISCAGEARHPSFAVFGTARTTKVCRAYQSLLCFMISPQCLPICARWG